MRFNYAINHVPGKYLNMADTLSKAPLMVTHERSEEIETFVTTETNDLPATTKQLERYQCTQRSDPISNTII